MVYNMKFMVFGNGFLERSLEDEIKNEPKIKFSKERDAYLFKAEDQVYLDGNYNLSERIDRCEEYLDSLGGFLECECEGYDKYEPKICEEIFYWHNHIESITEAVENTFYDEVYGSEDWGKEVDKIARVIVSIEMRNRLKEQFEKLNAEGYEFPFVDKIH
jgi:hypothetical protein